MASNYTENYGLCQWEAGDSFVRTEFNQDNAKIDTALQALSVGKAGRHQFIKSVSLPASPALSFTVDVSDIQWDEWETVSLIYDFAYDEINAYLGMELNSGNMDSYCCRANDRFVWTPAYALFLTFLPWHDASRPVRALCYGDFCGLSVGAGSFSQLEDLCFFRGDRISQYPPCGTAATMELWGTK